jgi:hypothetical protein
VSVHNFDPANFVLPLLQQWLSSFNDRPVAHEPKGSIIQWSGEKFRPFVRSIYVSDSIFRGNSSGIAKISKCTQGHSSYEGGSCCILHIP